MDEIQKELMDELQRCFDKDPNIPYAYSDEDLITLALILLKYANSLPAKLPISSLLEIAVLEFEKHKHR